MRGGRVVAELDEDSMTEDAVMRAAFAADERVQRAVGA
jgi:hypothetical protein